MVEQPTGASGFVLWTNTINFYNQLAKFWDDIRQAKYKVNDSFAGDTERALDAWLCAQQGIVDFLSYYLEAKEPETLLAIEGNYTKIKNLTQDTPLIIAKLDSHQLSTIKGLLETNDRLLGKFQGKYGFFLKQRSVRAVEDYAR